MSQFNDRLKRIKIKNLAIFIIIAYLVLFILGKTIGFINEKYFYVLILLYFVFELRDFSLDFKDDFFNVFSDVSIKTILLIVTANIFFSYGMLYLSYLLINHFPFLNFLVNFSVPSMSILSSLPVIGVFVMTVVLSPIVEELIFRGVLLNKLKLIVPTLFAVLISSLLFGALHSF
jgi:membrane protease YdiL (CAAX protease family)